MTLGIDDSNLIQRVAGQHINEVPKYQQEYVLGYIHQICAGTMSYDGGLNEIYRRYGQRIRGVAKKILDGILLEAAVPSETG